MAKARLSALLSEVRGTIDGNIVTRGRSGDIIRRPPTYRCPINPNRQAVQERMKAVNAAWNRLDHAGAMAWTAYAATRTRTNPVDGTTYHPTGQNVFVALASKFLQIDPTSTVPLTPPTTDFLGDRLTISLTGGTGQVLFTASAPNAPSTATELLLQKLKTPRRSPTAFYKSQAFVTFAPGTLDHPLPLEPGWYAGAIRFVQPTTGQMTELITLGVVEVG